MDLTDDEWQVLESLLSGEPRSGRRRAWPLRENANSFVHVRRPGCTWRLPPGSFPPWRTVYRCLAQLRDGSVVEEISNHQVILYRDRADQEASLAAPVIDRQSVTTTECDDAHGSGAGKKINLIKRRGRHAMMIGTR